MVRKETCPRCKGNRLVRIQAPSGRQVPQNCPECGGKGYKIRLDR